MTLEELAASFPNRFHDAFLKRVEVDYSRRTAVLDFEVWVGDLSQDYALREAYRFGRLWLTELLGIAVDLPNREYLESRPNGLPVDLLDPEHSRLLPSEGWEEVGPARGFAASFGFTDEWNSYLHLAAGDAQWEWLSEARTIY